MISSMKVLLQNAISFLPSIRSNARPMSLFENLPLELKMGISDHLDASDIACLSLCSHTLCSQLGTSSWHALGLDPVGNRERQNFLSRIARDHKKVFFCYTCGYLHPLDRVGPPGQPYKPKRPLPCICINPDFETPFLSFMTNSTVKYFLWFQHVQLVMARHRYGPGHGVDLEVLATTELREHDLDDASTLFSVEPKIMNNELHMRVQQWVLFPNDGVSRAAAYRDLAICAHFNGQWFMIMGPLLQCKLHHADKERGCRTCFPLLACTQCGTEFSLSMKDLGELGSALIANKWLTFGPGNSPLDPQWRGKISTSADLRTDPPISKADETCGLSSCFEKDRSKPLQQLTEENVALLSYFTSAKRFKGSGVVLTYRIKRSSKSHKPPNIRPYAPGT